MLNNTLVLIDQGEETGMADEEKRKGFWNIQDRNRALLASLPMLLFGGAVTLTWLVIGGPWYLASEGQLRAALIAGLAVCGIIVIGGLIALLKKFPDWGFTWLGVNIIGFLLLAKGAAEEGVIPITDAVGMAILIPVMLFSGLVLVIAVLRSWQAAGLVSIGMSTTIALSHFHMVAIGPYHRVNLVVLGLVFGFIFSFLTLFYTQTKPLYQALVLAGIGLINIAITWLANTIWVSELAKQGVKNYGRFSPFIPIAVIIVLIILATPLSGLLSKPLKKNFRID